MVFSPAMVGSTVVLRDIAGPGQAIVRDTLRTSVHRRRDKRLGLRAAAAAGCGRVVVHAHRREGILRRHR